MGFNTGAVEIEYNIVQAHYKIAELEEQLAKADAQCEMYKDGLKEYAESFWWNVATNMGEKKSLEVYLADAVRDYTAEPDTEITPIA